MKQARTLIGVVLATSMVACTSTRRFASEYKQQYYLAEDVNSYSCSIFTGLYSVWISGPERVETLCSAKIPVAGATSLKKGCPVRILKIFKIATPDTSYSDAKLEIVDTDTKAVHIAYIKWPGSKSLLSTEAPNPQE